jgi:AbrB family looped-hinge helix DNA binding protein
MKSQGVRLMGDENEPTKSMQDITKAMIDAQLEAVRRASLSQAEAVSGFLGSLNTFSRFGAVFKTSVQKAGRISIPEAERRALEIKEGDLVQVVVIPIKKNHPS